jgi:hypothetical protein
MIASGIIFGLCVALLLRWFRYSCGLILSAKPARDYAREVAARNELGFLEVQEHLAHAHERGQLDTLQKRLECDYYLLAYLLHHSPALGAESLERRMIMLDFELMKAYYALASKLSRSRARAALQEMAQVVSYFANSMGERAACTPSAE